jgi:hypothetical protein
MKSLPKTESLFTAGIRAYEEALGFARSAKERAIMAGFHFAKAQALCKRGQWEELVASHAQTISQAQIYRCIEFASAALEWARAENPQLEGEDLERKALEVVMRSPKPMTALMREMRLVEQVGAYDPQAYADTQRAKRLEGPKQLEFLFEETERHIQALVLADNVERLELSSLEKLERDLEAGLSRVRQIKASKQATADNEPATMPADSLTH